MIDASAVRRMILQTKSLPTIPSVLYNIIDCVGDDSTSASDLKKIVLNDQSISAKILNVANSAWFGFARRVEDISRAIVVLGFDTVLEISMYVSFSTFIKEASNSSIFEPEKFWMHSIASSEGAKHVAKDIKAISPEVANLIGLLHDIGKVMINYLYPREYEEIVKEAASTGESLSEIEKKRLGFDHSEVGEWLSDKWKFPPRLAACVEYHHSPESAPKKYLWEVQLAHIANNLAKIVAIGESGNLKTDLAGSRREKVLPYTKNTMNNWVSYLSEQEEKIKSFVHHMS